MIIVQICIGSSCHIKGSSEIVELFQKYIKENGLGDEIVLTGAFCSGACNRNGVTVTINDDVYTGITALNFAEFWKEKVMKAVNANR